MAEVSREEADHSEVVVVEEVIEVVEVEVLEVAVVVVLEEDNI